jgi:hypothetical protein
MVEEELQTQEAEPVKKESQWKGYKVKKGEMPPWSPFKKENQKKRKRRLTIRERKFLYVLSKTGSMKEAYLAAYTVKDYGDKKLQAARVSAMAQQVLARLKEKAPELTRELTFGEISSEFVKKGLLDLLNNPTASIHEKTRIYELIGKMNDVNMFSDKHIVETRVKEIVKTVYKEGDEDFPIHDERRGRDEIDGVGRA